MSGHTVLLKKKVWYYDNGVTRIQIHDIHNLRLSVTHFLNHLIIIEFLRDNSTKLYFLSSRYVTFWHYIYIYIYIYYEKCLIWRNPYNLIYIYIDHCFWPTGIIYQQIVSNIKIFWYIIRVYSLMIYIVVLCPFQ